MNQTKKIAGLKTIHARFKFRQTMNGLLNSGDYKKKNLLEFAKNRLNVLFLFSKSMAKNIVFLKD